MASGISVEQFDELPGFVCAEAVDVAQTQLKRKPHQPDREVFFWVCAALADALGTLRAIGKEEMPRGVGKWPKVAQDALIHLKAKAYGSWVLVCGRETPSGGVADGEKRREG